MAWMELSPRSCLTFFYLLYYDEENLHLTLFYEELHLFNEIHDYVMGFVR